MEHYLNKSGNSPITKFRIEEQKVTVWYNDDTSYSYSYARAGQPIVDKSKRLHLKEKAWPPSFHSKRNFCMITRSINPDYNPPV